jgi:hypothetical protein
MGHGLLPTRWPAGALTSAVVALALTTANGFDPSGIGARDGHSVGPSKLNMQAPRYQETELAAVCLRRQLLPTMYFQIGIVVSCSSDSQSM